MLEAAGWAVQDARAVNLAASRGVAVREFVMKRPHGRADYLLFLDGRAAGVVDDNLPAPEVIAQEIIEDLEAALTEFAAVAQALTKDDEA